MTSNFMINQEFYVFVHDPSLGRYHSFFCSVFESLIGQYLFLKAKILPLFLPIKSHNLMTLDDTQIKKEFTFTCTLIVLIEGRPFVFWFWVNEREREKETLVTIKWGMSGLVPEDDCETGVYRLETNIVKYVLLRKQLTSFRLSDHVSFAWLISTILDLVRVQHCSFFFLSSLIIKFDNSLRTYRHSPKENSKREL